MRFSLRAALIALVGLVAVGGLVTSGVLSMAPSEISIPPKFTSGDCTKNGVGLLIDYGSNNEIVPQKYCATDFSGNGWELFAATGVRVTGTAQYPIGFVCRINDYPSSAEQPCTGTPTSAEGSWAYYYATAQLGDHWMFSATGASQRKPKCGDMDAWVFIQPGEKSHEPSVAPQTFKCQN